MIDMKVKHLKGEEEVVVTSMIIRNPHPHILVVTSIIIRNPHPYLSGHLFDHHESSPTLTLVITSMIIMTPHQPLC